MQKTDLNNNYLLCTKCGSIVLKNSPNCTYCGSTNFNPKTTDLKPKIIFQLTPDKYLKSLYNYENKFALYTPLLCQEMINEKHKRLTKHTINNTEIKIDELITILTNNYIAPDEIQNYLNKKLSKETQEDLKIITNRFNDNYVSCMEEFIDKINYIADEATLNAKNIKPKGMSILRFLSYKNLLAGISANEQTKENNKHLMEIKIEKTRDNNLEIITNELYLKLINAYKKYIIELKKIIND